MSASFLLPLPSAWPPAGAGVRWHFHPGWVAGPHPLFGPEGLPLDEWLAAGLATVVKERPHRTVYRVRLPGNDFHVKVLRPGRHPWPSRWLRRAVRREHERTLAVAARGVPAPRALAFGEPSGAGPALGYLVTRTVPDAQPLSRFLESVPPPALRQILARALGEFLARMHQAGVVHADLHPGNLLLRLDHEGRPHLYLVDLADVRVGPPLGRRASQDNLVVLNRWFALRASRTDRLRFWRAYDPAARADTRTPRHLEERTLASNLAFWRRRDPRCLGSNRYFRRINGGGLAGHAVADLPADVLAPFLADPDEPFRRPGVRVLKQTRSSAVVELDLPGPEGPRRVVYKRFAVTAWTDPFTALVRPTGALRSWALGHALRLRCLPTPRPLAVWHRVRLGLPREGYLLVEALPDAVPLCTYLDTLVALPGTERRLAAGRLLERLALLVRQLHARRLSHRDLKAANVLASPAGWCPGPRGLRDLPAHPGGPHLWFVDLVGVRRHRRLSQAARARDLARLNASFLLHPALTRADRLRFLLTYLGAGARGPVGWKAWWGDVERATRRKVLRNLRKGRPLG
jgi:tRNA A-37 threonylcarbamoyl transferase component Bud32